MSLNPLLVESLYGEDLYQIAGKMLIILPKAWDQISPEEKIQLSKILGAVKLNLESVQIITREFVTIASVLPFSPFGILSFGVPFQPEINPYENTETHGLKIIFVDGLDSLDEMKKRNLWLALKNMFGV